MSDAPKAVTPSVNGWNADYLDSQYAVWKNDPTSVPEDLRSFFQGFDLATAHAPIGGAAPARGSAPVSGDAAHERAQAAVNNLIQSYRDLGHLCARIDPFNREREAPEELNPQFHGLTQADMDRSFVTGGASGPEAPAMPLRRIIEILDETYCRSIGVEISHVSTREEWEWLVQRTEQSRNKPQLSKGQRAHVLLQLHRAELFERFCAKRYPGTKRFSVEGLDSLIPLLDRLIEHAGDAWSVDEIVFAMAHRGRLNVLVNIMGKTYEQIFTEFEDLWREYSATGGGDVKYHNGYSSARQLPSGKSVWVCMCSNPSHLEAVDPVAVGRVRAKQVLGGDNEHARCIPVVLHGDAAASGQGVVFETVNLAKLDGYNVGGTVHVVTNNLIGFTTNERDGRSCRYATDVFKLNEAPVFHVNAEDPEAVVHAITMALDYRMTFKKDAIVDLIGYRRHGHNETDEAAFTQPLLYKEIARKPSVLKTYAERLLAEGVITEADMEKLRQSIDEPMDQAWSAVRKGPVKPNVDPGLGRWENFGNEWSFTPTETGIPRETLGEIAASFGRWPDTYTPHPKLVRILQERARCVKDDQPLDWGTAEALAMGSLLLEGTLVRLAGQDVRRGTFSHRHAVLRDVETGEHYTSLNHIREAGRYRTAADVGTLITEGPSKGKPRQAELHVYDSPLSEFACLGYEYGFSLASPNMLVLWEAQFGDFNNGAQIIIDQFITGCEIKWKRWSGLVMLLPHGYEGQGSEHSSARFERFLSLCADENIQVCNATTPAQYFHMLRRQVRRNFRKPLIVMSPKSLLRLPAATSKVDELVSGVFHEVLDDPAFVGKGDRKKVKRVILCTGKVYYDLVNRRADCSREDIAIVRMEQLYPFHSAMVKQVIDGYPANAEVVWVQEEPQNAGAWTHMLVQFREHFGRDLPYIGRPPCATTATGSPSMHKQQLDVFLTDAIGPLPPEKAQAMASQVIATH